MHNMAKKNAESERSYRVFPLSLFSIRYAMKFLENPKVQSSERFWKTEQGEVSGESQD
jgi:hypothetical protein